MTVKRELFIYLFHNRNRSARTAYRITKDSPYAWNTIKKYLDEMVDEGVVVEVQIMKQIINPNTGQPQLIPTGKLGYKINIPFLEANNLI
jgi:hypothetical protein